MKITLHQDTCIGMGECVFAAPAVFTQRDEDGIVEIAGPPEGHDEAVRQAAFACPTGSITVTED